MAVPPFDRRDLPPELDLLAATVVDAAGEVRRELGAGLVESVYVECLVRELRARGIKAEPEVSVPVSYKGVATSKRFRVDLLVADAVIIEAKSVEELHPVHFAQLLTYLRLSGKAVGFLINFSAVPFRSGIHRRVMTR